MSKAARVLSVEDVISLVRSIGIPVSTIEKELGIPNTVLARALKPNTTKPLPAKFEAALIEYAKQVLPQPNEDLLADEEDGLSVEELENKKFWVESVRAARVMHLLAN